MSDTYTKLFSSITESTVWGESYPTRIVWVAMLAMADKNGCVYGSVPGLARRANVTLAEVESALESFRAPDPYSRTQAEDGRRIEDIDGGWRLVNHGKYAAVRNADERREYKKQWDREHRSKAASESDKSDKSDTNPTNPTGATPPALTPTPIDQEQKQKPERVQPAAARSRFEDFWRCYPNKKGKQEAEKTWHRRKLDAQCDDLIAHVALMEATDSDWHRGYVPMGSTYLNQARWEDVPKRPPESGPAVQQIGKQMQGVMALEERKRELQQRLAGNRDLERPAATRLLVVGSDTGG